MPAILLCAVADDDHAEDVVTTARALAGTGDFRAHFVHVAEPHQAPPAPLVLAPGGPSAVALPPPDLHEPAEAARERGAQLLRDAGIADDEATVVAGDAAAEIERLAGELGATLIVIGTHRRGALSGALAGSVGRALLHAGSHPVLIAREAVVPSLGGPVVCAVDLADERCLRAARLAASLASLMDRPLVLVSVVTTERIAPAVGPVPTPVTLEPSDDRHAAAERDLRAIAQRLPADVAECVSIDGTPPCPRIEEFAAGRRADLLVVGSSGKGFLRRAFEGSVSHELSRTGSRPLVVVPLG